MRGLRAPAGVCAPTSEPPDCRKPCLSPAPCGCPGSEESSPRRLHAGPGERRSVRRHGGGRRLRGTRTGAGALRGGGATGRGGPQQGGAGTPEGDGREAPARALRPRPQQGAGRISCVGKDGSPESRGAVGLGTGDSTGAVEMPFMPFNISLETKAHCLATLGPWGRGEGGVASRRGASQKPRSSKGLLTSAKGEAGHQESCGRSPWRFHRDPKAEPSDFPVPAGRLWAPRVTVPRCRHGPATPPLALLMARQRPAGGGV